jgi:hypothetical protein
MKINILMAASVLFASISAQADYKCTQIKDTLQLIVNENHHTAGGDTSIILVANNKAEKYLGTNTENEGVFYTQKKFAFPADQEIQLTINGKSKNCGRGSCDTGFSIYSGELKQNEIVTTFSCYETY